MATCLSRDLLARTLERLYLPVKYPFPMSSTCCYYQDLLYLSPNLSWSLTSCWYNTLQHLKFVSVSWIVRVITFLKVFYIKEIPRSVLFKFDWTFCNSDLLVKNGFCRFLLSSLRPMLESMSFSKVLSRKEYRLINFLRS